MERSQLEYLTDLYEKEVDKKHIGGCSLLVEHKGEVIYHNTFGTDKEDSIYRIFSMTKPITCVAIMILYERGVIDLRDSVSRYLPGFKNSKVYVGEKIVEAKRPLILQDLLNMTSGVAYPGKDDLSAKKMQEILEEELKTGTGTVKIYNALGQAPLHDQPGEHWYYGGSAEVLGAIIEVCTGMKFSEFLRKEIFVPLGMKDTAFVVPEEKANRMATVYMMDENMRVIPATTEKLIEIGSATPTKEPYAEMGGRGLMSTVFDYYKFAQMLLHKGTYQGVRILGQKTIDYMATNQLNEDQQKTMWPDIAGYGYSNLLRIMVDPGKATSNGTVGEFGWDGLLGNYFCVDPQEELIIVYMQQNTIGVNQSTRRKMRNIVYGAI